MAVLLCGAHWLFDPVLHRRKRVLATGHKRERLEVCDRHFGRLLFNLLCSRVFVLYWFEAYRLESTPLAHRSAGPSSHEYGRPTSTSAIDRQVFGCVSISFDLIPTPERHAKSHPRKQTRPWLPLEVAFLPTALPETARTLGIADSDTRICVPPAVALLLHTLTSSILVSTPSDLSNFLACEPHLP